MKNIIECLTVLVLSSTAFISKSEDLLINFNVTFNLWPDQDGTYKSLNFPILENIKEVL